MPNPRLDTYLRTHRRKSGLTQREVAFLLNVGRDGAQISRHERRRRFVSPRVMLGYEVIYGVPVGELFAGAKNREAQKIKGRMRALEQKLQAAQTQGVEARRTAKKLAWLKERHQI